MKNWATCKKVLASTNFFLRSDGIHLLRFLLNPRYNHDKIIRESRQSYLKSVSSIFTMEDTFLFSGILFSTQKGPRRSHFCERQRPSVANYQSCPGKWNNIRILAGQFFCSLVLWDFQRSAATHNQKAPDSRRGIAQPICSLCLPILLLALPIFDKESE